MCQASFEGGQFSPDAPTIEHLIPLSKGGADHPDNLVMTCYRCNERRWHNQDEWWEYGTQRLDANP
jgi:5-methylcytosine-specific restriction endonuclease McrA